ncbi:acyltransferase family protein [Streptomonospora wellingtoniae]|uniref:Acyltransferase family protein n=1 Tax=Streptomonospora wellingtoniae TaxID=3075544 RepID=A0ABU2KXM4_9ACTN|nr:acyltransferase family protein [Streptomonospora sp. DSM 45055]MDT0303788.1 acyltransferase family protein [Streptomonospora sp. DSM 45055]
MATQTRNDAPDRTLNPAGTPSQRRFLPEVQGLRAVAVGLVLVYHLDHDLLPGGYVGVDVFFVISGFLITSLLLREARRYGRVSLAGFYVRRIRRILPAASAVLVATGAGALWLLPEPRLAETARELAAAGLYVENLALADRSVDYLAAESAPSPVQHFWSLAVEEQFYLVWPLLFAACAALGARWVRLRVLGAAMAGVLAVSLTCSVAATFTDPAPAYFLPQTRVWELAAGGVLASASGRWVGPPAARWCLGWAGLGAIGWAALSYSDETPFPGVAAVVPVAGAVAVIAAGENGGRWSSFGLLSNAAARWGGDVSYALYLWHWPVVVFTLALTGGEALSPMWAVLAGAASVVLAWLTKAVVEDPVQRRGWLRSGRRAGVFAVVAALVVASVGGGLYARYEWLRSVRFDPAVHVGPRALGTPEPTASSGAPVYPSPVAADDDLPEVYRDECQAAKDETGLAPCVYGSDDADTAVAVVGDSHATHWVPALRRVAQERDWRVHVYTKASCGFTSARLELPGAGRPYDECERYNRAVLDELTGDLRPALVFTSSSALATKDGASSEAGDRAGIAAGMIRLWEPLDAAGSDVVAIRDTPTTRIRPSECVSRYPEEPERCGRTRDEAFAAEDPQLIAARETDADVAVVDLSDEFCTGGSCPPVIGNVLVYRDSHHITATYSRLLAPDLQAAVQEAVGDR